MIEGELWVRVDRLVLAALDLDASERGAFLDGEVGDEPEVRAQVEALLAACDESAGFMESAAVDRIGTHRPVDAPVPTAIGPYRVERLIGGGGMGEVYLANRADGAYRRQVAIKVLRSGVAGEASRRFRDERQILANLDHPGIAKLYGAGTLEDGRPYLVMEYISGTPIDHCADHPSLSLRERIELFRKVCAAVQFAHQNLVAHLDIKPGNILVTDDGQPKLLDFGIAKLLGPRDEPGEHDPTRSGQRPMTPRYASPEQLRGEPLTTASDIYSLGTILYLLLAGRPPNRTLVLAEGLEVASQEPTKPSRVVASEASRGEWSRPGTPRQWRRRLAGDLDSIASMALREHPAHRYSSVEQLSDDLQRYLDKLPVRARRATFGYYARRALARYKLAVGVAASVVAVVIAFVAHAAIQTARLEQERNRAVFERESAAEMLSFFIELFDDAAPYEGIGGSATSEQFLDAAARRLDGGVEFHPSVEARLRYTVGVVYAKLGLYDKAQPMLERAVSRGELLGGDDLGLAASLNALANVHFQQADFEPAERLYLRALAIRERLLPAGHVDVAESLHDLAGMRHKQEKLDRAQELFERALRIVERSPDRLNEAVVTHHLANVYRDNSDYQISEEMYHRALVIYRERAGHADVALLLNDLALMHRYVGDHERAASMMNRAVALAEDRLGLRHPFLVTMLRNQGLCFISRSNYPSAERSLTRALELSVEVFGRDHEETGNVVSALLSLYERSNRGDDARRLQRRFPDP